MKLIVFDFVIRKIKKHITRIKKATKDDLAPVLNNKNRSKGNKRNGGIFIYIFLVENERTSEPIVTKRIARPAALVFSKLKDKY